jgi:Zn-dependent protease
VTFSTAIEVTSLQTIWFPQVFEMSDKRDPRAHWLDEDPFDKLDNSSKTHTRTRDDGNWRKPHVRVVFSNQGAQPFFRSFGTSQQGHQPTIHTGSIWHFSKIEIEHLTQATIAFSLALAFMSVQGLYGAIQNPILFLIGGALYAAAIGPAFLLHEIAHKIVARKYGCWAEFRASPSGLKWGVIIAAAFGFVFMAPGAVMVAGQTTKAQFGKIAIAGPLVNVALWVVGIGMILLLNGINHILDEFLKIWLMGNAILAAFNMLPFGPLDGKKIKAWSDPIFWVSFVTILSIAYHTLSGNIYNILGV